MTRLVAPFAGWASTLEAVPDPVFAERMMGDGIAIDPIEGLLRAPCDATVIAVAPTGHSITLRLDNGAEVLIHVGIDTVALGGRGFASRVADGARVATQDALIEIDLDIVAHGASSLVTPIVVTNEGFAVSPLVSGAFVAAGDPVLEIVATGRAAAPVPVGDDTATCSVTVPMANGIHARPAARIAAALKPYRADVRIAAHGKSANARSTVALMTLGAKRGDPLVVAGTGDDARAAVTAIGALIEGGMGETGAAPAPARRAITPSSGPILRGVKASPGLAVGPSLRFLVADVAVPEEGAGIAAERAAFDNALARMTASLADDSAGIAVAHRALLDDPELRAAAAVEIARGRSAAYAWRTATRAQADALRATGDALLIERIADLLDIERQLITRLVGCEAHVAPRFPAGTILLADELLPSEFLALDAAALGGICTARGGPTSHVAILAASAGIPMLVAAGEGVLAIPDGCRVILDADGGTLDGEPGADALAAAEATTRTARAARAVAFANAATDCVMADGTRIEVFANLGSVDDAARAVSQGAEGCGLLRTEFLFLDRPDAPTEDEQVAAYAAVASALGGRPLIVRTLDIGGDKPVPYLPLPREDNPALGARGVRLGLLMPDLIATQFRAVLRGVPADRCRIMIPMIVDRGEFAMVRAIFDQARRDVGLEARIPLGVMIETPAAALLAAGIGADFLSVGTNDLTQYALAADRGNPALADRIDALHPAVLRLIAAAAEGTNAHGRWLGVCGGLASDPAAAPILIGLGVTELSAAPNAIPALKAAIRTLDRDDCRVLAARALACGTAQEVRAMLKDAG